MIHIFISGFSHYKFLGPIIREICISPLWKSPLFDREAGVIGQICSSKKDFATHDFLYTVLTFHTSLPNNKGDMQPFLIIPLCLTMRPGGHLNLILQKIVLSTF